MQLTVFHDPARPRDRRPIGAVTAGTALTLYLRCPGGLPEQPVRARLRLQGPEEDDTSLLEMTWQDQAWQVSFHAPERPGAYFYAFLLEAGEETAVYAPDPRGRSGQGLLYPAGQEEAEFRLTVYHGDFTAPEWLSRAVMYQIFPDRFAPGDPEAVAAALDYHRRLGRRLTLHAGWLEEADWQGPDYQPRDIFGGTLDAIAGRLDYLTGLGVDVIYLNPIFEAASNHRYDTADYRQVDPLLGGNEALARLIKECRRRGVRLILDGVFSHTGADSRYFDIGDRWGDGAFAHADSPYRSWYDFDPEYRHGYRCWWDFPSLPEVNEYDPSWQEFMLTGEDAVLRRWLAAGVSGWRLDVADELPDPVLEEIRRQVKDVDPQAAVIGEVWEDPVTKVSYGRRRSYALGHALDSVMNYPLRRALLGFALGRLDGWQLSQFLLSQRLNYPPPLYYSLMNLLSSHDVARVRTVLALGGEGQELSRAEQAAVRVEPEDDRRAARLQLLLASLIWCLPGMPAIYYGDEEGMQGLRDPFDRQTFRPGPYPLTAEYAALSRLRRAEEALTQGAAAFPAVAADVAAVLRWDGRSCLLALANRSGETLSPMVDLLRDNAGLTEGELETLASAGLRRARDLRSGTLFPVERGLLRPELPPRTCVILKLE